jgi:predicted nucleic acid-binding protein
MSRTYRFRQINRLVNRVVLTDANVLMFVYWPAVSRNDAALQYYWAFLNLLNHGVPLVVTMGIITEAANRVYKEQWKSWNDDQKLLGLPPIHDYKVFRASPAGIALMDLINKKIKEELLKQIELVGEKRFTLIEAESFFVTEQLDFSDKLIAALAKEHNYIVFTHDGDFANTDVDLLTSNGKLLRAIR